MRNSTLSILSVALIALILGSCSTSSDLTDTSVLKKRRYMKGYQVNIKGNNIEKKTNSITAEMESVETKPLQAMKTDNMAQASLSTDLTEADLAPNPIIPAASEPMKNTKADRKMKTSPKITQIESNENSSKHRASKKYRSNSNLVVPTAAVASGGESLVLYIILGIILPPLAVGLLYGIGTEFWISLVLTIIFWIPGMIYALIKVFQKF